VRVAWSPTLGHALVDREIRDACEAAIHRLEQAGTHVVEVPRVFENDPVPMLTKLASTYTWRTIEPFRNTPWWSKLDPLVVVSAELARATVSTIDFVEAEDARHRFNGELSDLFDRVDLLLCPTVSGLTPPCSAPTTINDLMARLATSGVVDLGKALPGADLESVLAWLQSLGTIDVPLGTIDGEPVLDWTHLTQPFNMTASPAGTVCVGFSSAGMPIGLQVIGPRYADLPVLATVALIEDTLGLDTVAPMAKLVGPG
jgi:Asp-tRNA(Asn)/Glu-tRNA(Gln) amidotransferase A subunit family amidase